MRGTGNSQTAVNFHQNPTKMPELGSCTLRWVIKMTQQLGWAAGRAWRAGLGEAPALQKMGDRQTNKQTKKLQKE